MPFVETNSKEIAEIVEKHKICDVFEQKCVELEEKIMKIKYYNKGTEIEEGQVYKSIYNSEEWLLLKVAGGVTTHFYNEEKEESENSDYLMINLRTKRIDGSPFSHWKEQIEEGKLVLVGELEE